MVTVNGKLLFHTSCAEDNIDIRELVMHGQLHQEHLHEQERGKLSTGACFKQWVSSIRGQD